VVPSGHAGDQTNGSVENGLQVQNVAVGEYDSSRADCVPVR